MNFFAALESSLTLILTFIAFFISWLCAYYLYRTTAVIKKTEARINRAEANMNWQSNSFKIHHTLNIALLNSVQTKNNIDLCSMLLDSCTNKSDILTTKAIENTLHTEINNAIDAISVLEKKRAFLDTKIRDAFSEVSLKNSLTELEQALGYVQILMEETQQEFENTEKIKLDILKVNQVLDKVLLKL